MELIIPLVAIIGLTIFGLTWIVMKNDIQKREACSAGDHNYSWEIWKGKVSNTDQPVLKAECRNCGHMVWKPVARDKS